MTIREMGIEINDKHSYRDFDLYLKNRDISIPKRKSVTATVPFMSGYYDFSALYGEAAYEDRTLEYSFDILEDSPEAAEKLKNDIIAWAATAQESKILDDNDPDNYFVGSYSEATYEEDENLPEYGGELTLTFMAQPYRRSRETDESVGI